jgi:hypothetical protein
MISEQTLTTYHKEIVQITNITCKNCVVLWPVKAEWKKVAMSVIRPVAKWLKYQIILIDFGTMNTVIINNPKFEK